MKYRLCFFFLCIETIVIVFLLIIVFSKPKNEYSMEINYFSPNSVLLYNDNIWSNISLTDNGDLDSVSINDYKGRMISVVYSEIGIVSYVISDDKKEYKIESFFPRNFPSDMIFGKTKLDNEIINEDEDDYFYRNESYNKINKHYKLNYNITPFFFDIE